MSTFSSSSTFSGSAEAAGASPPAAGAPPAATPTDTIFLDPASISSWSFFPSRDLITRSSLAWSTSAPESLSSLETSSEAIAKLDSGYWFEMCVLRTLDTYLESLFQIERVGRRQQCTSSLLIITS